MAIVIDGTAGVSGVDGSAGTPAVQGTDTNTGVFYPAADTVGVSTGGIERLRIESNGILMVATTANDTSARITTRATAGTINGTGVYCTTTASTGASVFFNPNGQVGTISVSGTATSYNTSSDYRLKHNIAPMTGALAKVSALNPVTYKWNADDSDGEGFIAHELAEVVPQCVTGEKDAVNAEGNPVYQGIDTSFLVAILTAAIQEQQALIQSLTDRITALEAK